MARKQKVIEGAEEAGPIHYRPDLDPALNVEIGNTCDAFGGMPVRVVRQIVDAKLNTYIREHLLGKVPEVVLEALKMRSKTSGNVAE